MLQYLSKAGDSHERHFEYFFANRSVTVIRWLVSGYDHAVHFTSSHQYLIEFGQYMRKHYDSGNIGRVPDISQIDHVLRCDPVLRDYADELWTSYWERFVGDALVGNFDRHMGNWGYITDIQAEKRKTFYKTILETRAEVILKPAYECCISGKYKMDSRERLEGGADYTEQDFERDG